MGILFLNLFLDPTKIILLPIATFCSLLSQDYLRPSVVVKSHKILPFSTFGYHGVYRVLTDHRCRLRKHNTETKCLAPIKKSTYTSRRLHSTFFNAPIVFFTSRLLGSSADFLETLRDHDEMLALAMQALSLVSQRPRDPWLPVIILLLLLSHSLLLSSPFPPPSPSTVDFLAPRHCRSFFPSFAFCYRTISTK